MWTMPSKGYLAFSWLDFDYNFTVRAYDDTIFDLAIPATFNDRDYELNVLLDATCVSPVNNICT